MRQFWKRIHLSLNYEILYLMSAELSVLDTSDHCTNVSSAITASILI